MKKNDQRPIKVIHTMADGSIRDSVEGYPVPVNETTLPAYRLLAAMTRTVKNKK